MKEKMLTMSPIGYVMVDEKGFSLRIRALYRPALLGLEGFSHIDVFWWCHKVDTPELRRSMECEKPYKKAPARLGVFATRSPMRPNPIALTVVPVLSLEESEGIIRVSFIDAEDGTPIVDIKPYHPCTDRLREVTVPDWCSHWPKWYEGNADFDWEGEFVSAC